MGIAPEGIYEERAVAVGIETTAKGDDYVSADFEIVDSDGESFTVEWRGWLTPKTEERTLQSLRFMGWDGDDIYDGLDGAKRNKVRIDVRHEEYNGKTKARVAFVNELADPVETEKKRKTNRERLRKKAKSIPSVAIQDDGDDIPF